MEILERPCMQCTLRANVALFSVRILKGTGKTSRSLSLFEKKRKRERESSHTSSSETYDITMVLTVREEASGLPVESHSRMCFEKGFAFLLESSRQTALTCGIGSIIIARVYFRSSSLFLLSLSLFIFYRDVLFSYFLPPPGALLPRTRSSRV